MQDVAYTNDMRLYFTSKETDARNVFNSILMDYFGFQDLKKVSKEHYDSANRKSGMFSKIFSFVGTSAMPKTEEEIGQRIDEIKKNFSERLWRVYNQMK